MSTVLITGASGGIGYELAKLFAKDHNDLVLVARSSEKLAQFADELHRQFAVTVKPVALDLSVPSASQTLFDELQRDGIAVDVLVNNAAYGMLGDFADIPVEESLGQIQLNITALTALTRLFLGPMKQRRSGKILNVASTAGFQAGPRMAVYYATKAYVISFSEALAAELEGSGVVVSCLCPGPTETGFQKRAAMENTALARKPGTMDAKSVALDGYRGLMAGKTLVISGVLNWLVAESVRFAPRKVVTGISKKLLESV
jgi:short-subunit dehydrogenase